MKTDSILKKLLEIQKALKVPKNQFNSFGKYPYRSCEDIMEAAKPLCIANGALLTVSDSMVECCGRAYVEATATIQCVDTGESLSVTASAREAVIKKGMDDSQITGATSSYARKYALGGLFSLDDTKDADTMKPVKEDDISVDILLQFIPSCKSVKELEGYYFKNKGFITSLFEEEESKINKAFADKKQQLKGEDK